MGSKRWGIALAAVVLQIALGAEYAWSIFRTPLMTAFHWNIDQVTLAFTIAIFVLGFAAYFGGQWSTRSGPRVVAMTGGLLYGLGVALASQSNHGLWWLYLTYGVIGGIGIGFAYIVPVAVLVKWFPDKRGLMTGIAVGGFGAGALITAPIATRLIASVGVLTTFLYLGIVFLIVTVACGYFMQNPPEGYRPEGWTPSAALQEDGGRSGLHPRPGAADVAVVGAVAAPVPEYQCRHFCDLARGTHVPRVGRGNSSRRGRYGGDRKLREWCRAHLLGLGL